MPALHTDPYHVRVTAAGEHLIAGRYRLAGEIGRGGMGVVWRAHDQLLNRTVAIKQLVLEDEGEESVEKAKREGRIAARLQHPNAISVHDVIVHAGSPCLVMDYVDAHSFGEVISNRGGRLPVDDVVDVGAQVAAALVAAHLAGIVHQDVKPENVLIGLDGQVKITDFGLAGAIGEGSMTKSGFVVGTPGFIAPEVASGADFDSASDVFSLGATLYNAIEGIPPFGDHEDAAVILRLTARGKVIPPRRAGDFTPFLMAMLTADPNKRPTMLKVKEELAARRSGHAGTIQLRRVAPAPSGPPGPQRPPGNPPRSIVHSRPFIGLVAALVLTVAALAVIYFAVSKNDTSRTNAPAPAAQPGATCQPAIVSTFPGPGSHEVTVEVWNLVNEPLNGWRVGWTLPAGQTIDDLTGGTLTQQPAGAGLRFTVDSPTAIPARGSVRFTFTLRGDVQVLDGVQMSCEGRLL
jgi:Protein kinase domain